MYQNNNNNKNICLNSVLIKNVPLEMLEYKCLMSINHPNIMT